MSARDVVILGAGPTGCALGAYLARGGASVTLVERDAQAQPTVGESLIPETAQVLQELGFDVSGFAVKRGAVFCEAGVGARFDFSEAESPRYPHAWQVPREVFDARWRELARREGCEFVHAEARDVDLGARTLRTSAGDLVAGRVVDAGGRSMWLSRKLGLREGDARLRNLAVGTRMRGVRAVDPDEPGDVTICSVPAGWIWIVPFGEGVASVGAVMTPSAAPPGDSASRLAAMIASSPDARARLDGAERIAPLRGLQDFTASSTRFYGEGFALCGDAACFIDPVFSSGLLLGLRGARGLAAALLGGDLASWEVEYRAASAVFRKAIDAWYDGDFMTLALLPRERQKPYVRRGLVSLLAGDIYDPSRRTARDMADRMRDLAAAVRERSAQA